MHWEQVGNIFHVQGRPSVGFQAKMYFLPKDVSFSACTWSEGTNKAVITGWWTQVITDPNSQLLDHVPGSDLPVQGGNITTGCRVSAAGGDVVSSTDQIAPPAYAQGTWIWKIPERYQVGSGAWHEFLRATQEFTIDPSGGETAQKNDTATYSAALNAASSGY
jgi:hypothetical protein